MEGLSGLLLSIGAPLLAKVIGAKLGPQAGVFAQGALSALSNALGAPGAAPVKLRQIIEADEPTARGIVRQVERDYAKQMELIGADMADYRKLLRDDNKRGLLSRIWRPIFALVYSLCFFLMIFTIAQAVWSTNIEGINALIGMSGVIIALFTTGAAVLGVYVWGRTGEKKAGVV